MHVGTHGHGHGHAFGHRQLSENAQAMMRDMAGDAPTRGERLVARLDKDGDGVLAPGELQGSRLGKRMSVDRFVRLDRDEDGGLSAAELDAGRKGRKHKAHGPGMMESVVRANYADHLSQKVEAGDDDDGLGDVAARVIGNLDGDGSGALNSEEIAGTRLAQMIGGDFYQIDADRNGALDEGELAGFVAEHLSGMADPEPAAGAGDEAPEPVAVSGGAAEAGAVGDAEEVDEVEVDEADAATATDATPDTAPAAAAGAAAGAAARNEAIATAFEAALEILRGGAGAGSPYDVVQALYGEVQSILAEG